VPGAIVLLVDGMEIAMLVVSEPNFTVSVTADGVIIAGLAGFARNMIEAVQMGSSTRWLWSLCWCL